MYNSLSNIQKHLYSLIQQNNPEYLQQSTRQNIKEASSWRDDHPKEYAANVKKREDEEKAREIQRTTNKRRAQEDETLAYNTANSGSPLPMTDGIANDTAENRQKLTQFRTNNDNERQSTRIADVIDRTSKQDPSTLSSKDAGELALAKIMMKGGSLSKPNADLESKIKSKVADRQGKNVLSPELSGSGNQMQDDIDALAAAKNSPAAVRSKAYFDADTESTFDVSREATKRDMAQREQNARDKPISPFYRMTRNEFKSTLGRDFDESGGANPDNMRALLNHQSNLGQRLQDIDRDWHDKINFKAHTDSLPKKDTITIADMLQYWVTYHEKARKNDRDNPIRIHPETSLDVPPPLSPRERARIQLDAAGNPIDPNDPRARSLPTSPINTNWKTRDPFTGEEEWKMFDINLDQPKPTQNGICSGPFCQASNLTGKAVNSKVSRIA